jgi:hypothetical protein
MVQQEMSEYSQKLLDTIVGLRQEVQNLQGAYSIVHNQLTTMATLADRTTLDAVKETIDAEELARLSLVAAEVAYKAALVLGDGSLIDATQKSVLTAQEAFKVAQSSTIINAKRQTGGAFKA